MLAIRRNKTRSKPLKGPARVERDHAAKIERILCALDQASGPRDMDLPGFRLQMLKGDKKGHYGVWVAGDWQVTFRFEGKQAVDIDYVSTAK